VPQLIKIHGIKSGKAVQIVVCFELARRLETFDSSSKFKINSPEDVYRRLYPAMRESNKEHFVELCLDTKNKVIREDTISIGSLNANVVHPREVFRTALIESAAHIIVDKAIAILQVTSDGDKLAPLDLKLMESAVNGFLSAIYTHTTYLALYKTLYFLYVQ
jgi:hypothetical protein